MFSHRIREREGKTPTKNSRDHRQTHGNLIEVFACAFPTVISSIFGKSFLYVVLFVL